MNPMGFFLWRGGSELLPYQLVIIVLSSVGIRSTSLIDMINFFLQNFAGLTLIFNSKERRAHLSR